MKKIEYNLLKTALNAAKHCELCGNNSLLAVDCGGTTICCECLAAILEKLDMLNFEYLKECMWDKGFDLKLSGGTE